MTLEQAKKLRHGDRIRTTVMYHGIRKEQTWRVTGKVRTWKKQPDRIQMPIRHGLYTNGYLTELILPVFRLAEETSLVETQV